MAIQFCDDCGDTLSVTADQKVKCDCCGKMNKSDLTPPFDINGPQANSKKKDTDRDGHHNELEKLGRAIACPGEGRNKALGSEAANWASIEEDCPFCDATEVRYTTLQTRGADEGSTVFYFCPKCERRYKENS
ncbi:hypothetical protein MAPG_10781 [Magnaporthiopsis poae ATCC 64411]|uniref:DNA-directed RNA polymerase subunit n=1 Tax=Magnaporthiopsis poae (strain ATCC 64411 / 73-15) TaxID=644358 RepID=A0A0C4EDI1_MAGP6|nr:hypothetical protein MAPG_10781 [Magnaporthiopsis poae ATCC 64411]